jgi:hypothetical protein
MSICLGEMGTKGSDSACLIRQQNTAEHGWKIGRRRSRSCAENVGELLNKGSIS